MYGFCAFALGKHRLHSGHWVGAPLCRTKVFAFTVCLGSVLWVTFRLQCPGGPTHDDVAVEIRACASAVWGALPGMGCRYLGPCRVVRHRIICVATSTCL